jgi:hypothetical protein
MHHFSSSSGYDSFDCPSECHFRRFPPGIREMIFKDALDDHLNRWLYGNSNLIYFKNVSDDTCAANFLYGFSTPEGFETRKDIIPRIVSPQGQKFTCQN